MNKTDPPRIHPRLALLKVRRSHFHLVDRSAALGGTVTYDSGIKVTVKSDGFQPVGQYASGAVDGKAAVFELTGPNPFTDKDAIFKGAIK